MAISNCLVSPAFENPRGFSVRCVYDRYKLMKNELIEWDIEMLDDLSDKIDWTAIWKNYH